jgi:putative acetyltransferase
MDVPTRFVILEATTPVHIAEAKRLMIEYRDSISTPLCFQGFDAEMASLPGRYAPPTGVMLLALDRQRGVYGGCIALREIDAAPFGRICEMKRLYVAPASRGAGLGRMLALDLLRRASAMGYAAMRLDTDSDMLPARRLYESLGFTPIPKYNNDPIPDTLFFELRLAGCSEAGGRSGQPNQTISGDPSQSHPEASK